MELYTFSKSNKLLASLISQARNKDTEQVEFRSLLRRIGMFFGYEVANFLDYKNIEIVTPMNASYLGVKQEGNILIVSSFEDASYFAAGIGDVFSNVTMGKIDAPRKLIGDRWKAPVQKVEFPRQIPKDCHVIVAKTILASGCTATSLIGEVLKITKPRSIVVAAVVSHQDSCREIAEEYPYVPIRFVIGDLDPILDDNGYVIPGMGNVIARLG